MTCSFDFYFKYLKYSCHPFLWVSNTILDFLQIMITVIGTSQIQELQSNSTPISIYLHHQLQTIYLSLSNGSLLIYTINHNHNTDDEEKYIRLSHSILNFTSHPIQSLNIIKQTNSLVSLSAGDILLHDLTSFKLQSTTSKWTKAQATTFAIHSSILRQNSQSILIIPPEINSLDQPPDSVIPPDGSDPVDVPFMLTLLAVPCKRRLVIFGWLDTQWLTPKEISLPHQPRSLIFANPLQLFIGYSTGDYASLGLTVSVDAQIPVLHSLSDPFPSPYQSRTTDPPTSSSAAGLVGGLSGLALKTTGLVSLGLAGASKLAKNLVVRVGPPSDDVIGMRDHLAVFMHPNGTLARPSPSAIHYPLPPTETIVCGPYVLSLLGPTTGCMMVHSTPTLAHIQTVEFPTTSTKPLPTLDSSPRKLPAGQSTDQAPARRLLAAGPSGPVICVYSSWDEENRTMKYAIEAYMLTPWPEQIEELIEAGEYEEAVGLLSILVLPDRVSLLASFSFCSHALRAVDGERHPRQCSWTGSTACGA